MKVFQGLVNYGTQAGFFAKGLRNKGIIAISAVYSHTDKYNRQTDVILKLVSKSVLSITYRLCFFIKCLLKYNIFHFYFGLTLLPKQLDLYFYRLMGKKAVFHYLGADVDIKRDPADFPGEKIDINRKLKRLKNETRFADMQFVCAPCYSEFVEKSKVMPLAIDINTYSYTPMNNNEEIIFVHAPTRVKYKKTEYIENAIQRLKNEGYKFKYKRVTGVSHKQLLEEYKSCDVVIDQLNNWYGTVSVEAMAIGRPVVCGYWKEYFKYIDYGEQIPLINASIDNIYNVLKDILDKKYDLHQISKKSRKFVEEVHELNALTNKLIEYYKQL